MKFNFADFRQKMVDSGFRFRIGDVTVRQATSGDYQSVIDIDDNIYNGLDYMPSMFHQFLQSRHHLLLVFEENGKIVSTAVVLPIKSMIVR
jgi:hypothetical protein